MPESTTDKTGDNPNSDISALRRAIDEVDEKIMELINRRLSMAKQIGDFKKRSGIEITDPDREKEIMNRLLEKNNGPVSDKGLRNIFSAIMIEGRNIQGPGAPEKG
jgi:chorismate mutase